MFLIVASYFDAAEMNNFSKTMRILCSKENLKEEKYEENISKERKKVHSVEVQITLTEIIRCVQVFEKGDRSQFYGFL